MGWRDLLTVANPRVMRALAEPGNATISYADESTATVTAEYEAAHRQLTVVDGAQVTTTAPAAWVIASDLPALPQPGECTILFDAGEAAGILYRIANVRPDGSGGVWLDLYEAE